MKNLFQGYKVTSSHATTTINDYGNTYHPARVRVRSPAGAVVAEVAAKRGDVLRHCRINVLSEERALLVSQLKAAGTPQEVIDSILAMPAKGE